MIAHLRGKLIFKQPGQAVLEAAGVGYDVTISVPTFTALPSVGAEASLHIHTQVSEDQIALFGFLDREEKRLFERLLEGSGPIRRGAIAHERAYSSPTRYRVKRRTTMRSPTLAENSVMRSPTAILSSRTHRWWTSATSL